MVKKEADERWMEGRDRPVRVYLTEHEHATVRRAAALVDKSVSRFSVEAIVKEADEVAGESAPTDAAQDEPGKPAGKPATGRTGGKAARPSGEKGKRSRKRKEG